MAIKHNHAYNFEMRTNHVSNNCPKCRLDLYAEELLEAAERATRKWPSLEESIKLQTIIDKIRGD